MGFEDEEDLDDDEIAAKAAGTDHRLQDFTEEELETMAEEQQALLHRAWQFELRTGYVKEQIDDEAFRRTLGRDINSLAFADIKDFLKQFPGYDAWMSTHLDGVEEQDVVAWSKRDPAEKEQIMAGLMDAYGSVMYKTLAERQQEPYPREAVFTEEGQKEIWGNPGSTDSGSATSKKSRSQ